MITLCNPIRLAVIVLLMIANGFAADSPSIEVDRNEIEITLPGNWQDSEGRQYFYDVEFTVSYSAPLGKPEKFIDRCRIRYIASADKDGDGSIDEESPISTVPGGGIGTKEMDSGFVTRELGQGSEFSARRKRLRFLVDEVKVDGQWIPTPKYDDASRITDNMDSRSTPKARVTFGRLDKYSVVVDVVVRRRREEGYWQTRGTDGDLGINIGVGNGKAWIIGGTLGGDNEDNEIRFWTGNGWSTYPNGGALRDIGVDTDGTPVIVNHAGHVHRLVDGQWQILGTTGDQAERVGVGGGKVWIIGGTLGGDNKDNEIRFWEGSWNNGHWSTYPQGGAKRDIGVDNDGVPVIANHAGHVHRLVDGQWQILGTTGDQAERLDVGGGKVWIIGGPLGGDNEDNEIRFWEGSWNNGHWSTYPQGRAKVDIAVDNNGKPWILNHRGRIHQMK